MGFPIRKVLGKRPTVSGGRCETQRKGFRCKLEFDAAYGQVVKTMKVLLAPSLSKEKGKGQLTAGVCPFRLVDRGKSEARFPSTMVGRMEYEV